MTNKGHRHVQARYTEVLISRKHKTGVGAMDN